MNENTTTPIEEEVVGKPGFKHTKLGWIPEDWEISRVSNCASKIGSGSTPKGGNQIYVSNGIPFIRSQNVVDNRLELDVNSCIPLKVHESMKNTIVRPGDVLLNITGASIGRSCVVPSNFQEGNVNQHVCIIRTKQDKLLNYYLQFYLSSFSGQKDILRMQVGGNREGLNHSGVGSIKLPIPSLPEQKSISQCLTTWDTAITKLDTLIKAKQRQKRALMQQLLSSKKRLPGFDGEWEEFHLSDIAKRVTRKNTELNDDVVTISAQKGFVKQEDFFNKRVASSTLENYTLVKKGEYCYNKSYSNGYPMGAFKRLDDFDKAVVTTLYICFRLRENVNSDFINQFFEAGRMIQGLMRIAQEGGRAHGLLNISLSDFFGLKLYLPSLQEQGAIAEVLKTSDKEIQLLQRKLDLVKLQKKGLMQLLLTGKKRLKD